MTSSDYILVENRFAASDGTWLAAADADITNWTKTDRFTICIIASCSPHGGCSSRSMQFRYTDVTAGGSSWFQVSVGDDMDTGGGIGTDPGNYYSATQHIFSNTNYMLVPSAKTQNQTISLAIVIDASNAIDGHEYAFALYDQTDMAQLDTCLGTITMAITAPEETSFNTMVGSAIGWIWGTATIDTDSAPRSPTANGLGWVWEVVSNTSTNYIPSGNELSWDWCVEDAG